MKAICIIFVLNVCAFATHAKLSNDTNKNLTATPSLSFLENKGQITDQYYNQRADIQFKVTGGNGLNIFIGNSGINYQFNICKKSPLEQKRATGVPQQKKTNIPENMECALYRMDVVLIGANKNSRLVAEEKQDYYENYFTTATDGHSVTACSYNKITYKDIYPKIDWVLYINNGQLEHEFIVHEGGHINDIQLKYYGATSLKLNADGSLVAGTPQGRITERPPVSYEQSGRTIKSSFKLYGNILSYESESYTGTLVIDPALDWATYFGGNNIDESMAITVDGLGNSYMTGGTFSFSNIATSGAYQDTIDSYLGTLPGNGVDAFLAKFNSSGNLQWATYYGGEGQDGGYGLATDSYNNVYIVGITGGTTGIATVGSYQDTYGGGNEDAFLAKFSSTGTMQWATYFGGNDVDEGFGIAIDSHDNIYITGATASSLGIATPSAYQPSLAGGDAFIAKFNTSGNILWSTYFGGAEGDQGHSITTDYLGNVYITGITSSTSGLATPGANQTVYGGDQSDAFIAKFDSSGDLQWATYYGGSGQEEGYGIVADPACNVYTTGFTTSTSSIATPGAYQTGIADTSVGAGDAYIAKFNSSGAIQWATYYGGSRVENGNGIAIDNAANVYITGETNSTIGMTTTGAYQGIFGGGITDGFLAKFNSGGDIQWATYYGGNEDDYGYGVKTDGAGYVYVTGSTSSVSGISTLGSYQPVEADSGISWDAYLAKFSSSGTLSVKNLAQSTPNISIYPNPTQNDITISALAPIRNVVIENVAGQTIYSNDYNSNKVVINLADYPSGIYIVTVNDNKTYKVVRQ